MAPWRRRIGNSLWVGLACWVAALGLAASPVRADFITFDPDGAGPSPELTNIGTFNYSAGNALAAGALPLVPGQTFQLYFQARLNSVSDNNDNTITPAGLNGTQGAPAYEITVVASMTEVVTSVGASPPQATFSLAAVQSANSFIELYYDPSRNSNPLAGTGFNDGTLILKAAPAPAISNSGNFSFANNQPNPLPNFDEHGTNNYPGVQSVVGSGSANITATVSYQNTAFFPNTITAVPFSPIGTGTPFNLVDPSHLFASQPNGAPPTLVPDIGTVNGGPPGAGGPDFQFQAIAQNGFIIPEPGSLTLMGLGLVSVLGFTRLSRKRTV
jgi:hypothetical protein